MFLQEKFINTERQAYKKKPIWNQMYMKILSLNTWQMFIVAQIQMEITLNLSAKWWIYPKQVQNILYYQTCLDVNIETYQQL